MIKNAIVRLLKRLHFISVYKFYKKVKARFFKFFTLRIVFPRAYYKNAKKPVDPNKIVFIEVRLKGVTNSFKLLYDKLITEYDYDIHTHFLRSTFVPRREYFTRCRDMMADIATAKYVFVNEASNVVSCVKVRPETIVTQTWHGCGAFKKFGFSTAELIFGETRKEMLRFPFYKNFTYLTISSPEVAWVYEEAMNLHETPEVIKPIGISRTDVFYDKKFIGDSFKKLYAYMPSAEGKKVILYAPTFRGRVANGKSPAMFNVEMFKKELGDEYVVLIKHHPLVRKPPVIPSDCNGFAADLSDAMDIEELLAISDICISDYSSLVFEYSLYERPLIFFSYDLDEYFDWRGFYYDYNELAPGPVFKTNLEMIDYIKNIDTRFDKARVHAFREKFMSSCDGHSTERIMQTVFGDDLKNHRRETALEGVFHDLPNADELYSERKQRIDKLQRLSAVAKKLYTIYSGLEVDKNTVLILYNDVLNATLERFKNALLNEKSVVVLNANGTDLDNLIKAIATSGTIVLSETCEVINVLELRKETKVIQLWNKVFPFQKFGYSSRRIISGLENDYLKIAPLHNNYSLVSVASESLCDIYKQALNTSADTIQPLGAASTDILFSEKFREQSRNKLVKVFPHAEGKKVIFYLHEPRVIPTNTKKKVFVDYKYMNEYLSDDYVLVYYSRDELSKKMPLSKYFSSFMANMYGKMSIDELMSVADIMVGDYKEEVFTFAATGKPIFLYAPDYKTYFYKYDSYFGYEDIAPGPIFSDSEELAKAISNIESYDWAKLTAFREKYLANCDGKVIERIIKTIFK